MSKGPKDNEERLRRMLSAWETLAPAKTFGGITLAQFQAQAQPALNARQQIETLEDQLAQALNAREAADAAAIAKAELVINGVRGDPTEGPDSTLYEAMGYTRKSERKSGLTRKTTRKPPE